MTFQGNLEGCIRPLVAETNLKQRPRDTTGVLDYIVGVTAGGGRGVDVLS